MAILCATFGRHGGRVGLAAVTEAFMSPATSQRLSFTTVSKSTSSKSIRRRRPAPNTDNLYATLYPKEYEAFKKSHAEIMKLKSTAEDVSEVASSEKKIVFPLRGKNVDEEAPRMRFAPSPTGSLHVGGARTALYNWLVAKKGQLDLPNQGGGFVLRVEDTDLARSTKESEESVLADLKWLGLYWDEGPDDVTAEFGPYRQSERAELYSAVAQQLLEEGKAYRCFCTKEELEEMKQKQEAEGIPPRYDGTWRDADPELVQKYLDEGREFTVRFKVPPGSRVVIEDIVRGTVSWDAESTVGDFILLRSTGVPVYNFCVAVDDASMGITTVVRAEEHLTNTLRQGLILDALNAPRPRYAHCSLILGEDKMKLSKRHGATSCNQFRLDGYLPDAMINYLSLLGWNDGTDNEIFSRDELIDTFDLERVVKSPSVFDMEKLNWINSQHLKLLSIEEVVPMVKEQFTFIDMLAPETSLESEDVNNFAIGATCLAKQMMETTRRAATNAIDVLGYNLPASFSDLKDGTEEKEMIKGGNFYLLGQKIVQDYESNNFPQPNDANILEAFSDPKQGFIVEDNETGGGAYSYPESYKVYMKSLAKEFKVKGKNLFHPVRYALTGEMSGQDVTKQLSLLEMGQEMSGRGTFNDEVVKVVQMKDRIEKLKGFLETIPEEFRAPKVKESKENKGNEQKAAKDTTSEAAPTATEKVDLRATYEGPPVTALDIRVGLITKAWEHPESDKLWCEEIDLGEDEPRQVASGLREFYSSASDLEGRKVLVVSNLKSRKLAGFPSHGMVLCSSNEDHTDVKIISVPHEAKIGERVTVSGWDFESEDGKPFAENKLQKKKILQKLAPFMTTDEFGTPGFLGSPFITSGGVCSSPLSDGQVS
eukprot:CAMPEP_0178955550 /NCGR_PEP_ID=MMETSP0789-20121207/9670_1 /TAXON_ID=3005 /ORGANISM="Rhizosolenia setigera, Strain CCMP 1694" /LENGTH=878 /DNA_ID=CAMNT_0020637199 /DNA_START=276 /DNA_END=2912 /DNA_ORIENTATION=-